MSDLVSSQAIPQHIVAMRDSTALTQSLAGGFSGESVPRISIKASKFRLVEGGTETVVNETKLNVVIVGANPNMSKLWYKNAFNPSGNEKGSAPDCFSESGVAPHPSSETPQSDSCATCDHNVWGSKTLPNGKDAKSCSDQKRLAVVSALDVGGQVYLLQVTPSALKNLNTYQRNLVHKGLPAQGVITVIGFDPTASHPKLTFEFGGFVNEEDAPILESVISSDNVRMITGEA